MQRLYRRTLRYFCIAGIACLLAGCIDVDDFGAYWDKGFVDACANAAMLKDAGKDEKNMVLRSLRLGDHTFLMVRKHAEDKGGSLIRYEVSGGEFITYYLNDSKREDFLHYYPHSGVALTTSTATIPVLNGDSAALLESIANDKSYWVESERKPYNPTHRTDCAQHE